MGTWDIGPFDNDDAADWALDLDGMPEHDRSAAILNALDTALRSTYLDDNVGKAAIAAAAIVAAQCPGGHPTDPVYGPGQPIPELTHDLRPLAAHVLTRFLDEATDRSEYWATCGNDKAWRTHLLRLRVPINAALEDPDQLTLPF